MKLSRLISFLTAGPVQSQAVRNTSKGETESSPQSQLAFEYRRHLHFAFRIFFQFSVIVLKRFHNSGMDIELVIIESKFSSRLGRLQNLTKDIKVSVSDTKGIRVVSPARTKLSKPCKIELKDTAEVQIHLTVHQLSKPHKSNMTKPTASLIGLCNFPASLLLKKYFTCDLLDINAKRVGTLSFQSKYSTSSSNYGENVQHSLPDFNFSRFNKDINWNRLFNLDMKRWLLFLLFNFTPGVSANFCRLVQACDIRKLECFTDEVMLGDVSDEGILVILIFFYLASLFKISQRGGSKSIEMSRAESIHNAISTSLSSSFAKQDWYY